MTHSVKAAETVLAPKVEVKLFLMALDHLAYGHKISEFEALSNMDEKQMRARSEGLMLGKNAFSAYMAGIFADCYSKAHHALNENPPEQLSRSELAKRLREIFPAGRAAEDFRDNILDVFDKINAELDSGTVFGGYHRTTANQPETSQDARITSPIAALK